MYMHPMYDFLLRALGAGLEWPVWSSQCSQSVEVRRVTRSGGPSATTFAFLPLAHCPSFHRPHRASTSLSFVYPSQHYSPASASSCRPPRSPARGPVAMSSPFNPLTPSLGLPGPSGTTPYMNLGVSPSAALSPGTSPWFQLAPGSGPGANALSQLGLGGFGMTPGGSGPTPSALAGMGLGSMTSMGGMGMGGPAGVGLLAPPTHTVPASTDLDDALRVFPDIARRIERAEQLRAECAQLEARVFREGSEGMDSRIEGVQLECESPVP